MFYVETWRTTPRLYGWTIFKQTEFGVRKYLLKLPLNPLKGTFRAYCIGGVVCIRDARHGVSTNPCAFLFPYPNAFPKCSSKSPYRGLGGVYCIGGVVCIRDARHGVSTNPCAFLFPYPNAFPKCSSKSPSGNLGVVNPYPEHKFLGLINQYSKIQSIVSL
jgi:hypothetical protein